jgi:catalase-peroxidase
VDFTLQVPDVDHELIGAADIDALKATILGSVSVASLVRTAWASAATFRHTDFRGGANGARIRLAPQKDWAVNNPPELSLVLKKLEEIQGASAKKVSLADVIVLGGCAAIEEAAKKAGNPIQVPFSPGRTDASQDQTDLESFGYLEPVADGFRNHLATSAQLVDHAHKLSLTATEMTVLVGGMRALNANTGQSPHGVLTKQPETLTNDFFVNLLDMSTTWEANGQCPGLFNGKDMSTVRQPCTCTDYIAVHLGRFL